MLVLEVMSLFMLGLLGAALPAGGSDDDDEDRPEEDAPDTDARAPAETDDEGEALSLLDYAVAGEAPSGTEAEAEDPWLQEAQDAAVEAELDEPETDEDPEGQTATDLDVLAAIARLTAATPHVEDEDEDAPSDETAETAGPALAAASPGALNAAGGASTAWEDFDQDDDDEDTAASEPADDQSVTTIVDYQPGSDQIEITIFAPPPDTAVDVVLQQTADGSGTEVLIAGKLRAVLDGVLPGDVDANDLYIEFAG